MKIFSIICTRDKVLNGLTRRLVNTLSSYGVDVKVLANQKSIFEAYELGLSLCNAKDTDIIIFCHDDLQILSTKPEFLAALSKCIEEEVGIIGPAGTTYLGQDAVWWNQQNWQAGYHRGEVKHYRSSQITTTHYGPFGQVVALDGLFLAAKKSVWSEVSLKKPEYFEGDWDFYDIHYTTTCHGLGYKNYAVPINMIHQSKGELVGRDSWHKNRESFIHNTELPLTC